MIATIRAEILKLRRPGVIAGVGGSIVGLAVLSSVLVFATAKDGRPSGTGFSSTVGQLAESGGVSRGFSLSATFLGLVIFVLFLTATTSEYGLGTIRVMTARQPRRVQYLVGRYLTLIGGVALALLAAEIVSVGASSILATTRGISTSQWWTGAGLSHVAGDYGNALVAAAMYGGVAFALGTLIRSTAVALGVGIVWFMPLEHLLQLGWSGASRWLPGLSFDALARGGDGTVAFEHALVVGMIYAGVAAVVALWCYARRDVTA